MEWLVLTQWGMAVNADAQGQDQLFTSYQQLMAQGVPLDAIRQQMERENVRSFAKGCDWKPMLMVLLL